MKIESAEFLLSANHRRQFLDDGRPQIAFVGRSNVGKSSLLNTVLQRKKLARTGSTPGRTRAINYFLINRRFYFVDLPGYGFAKASKTDRASWAELMDQYFRDAGESGSQRCLLTHLVDGKVGATELDAQAREYFLGLGLNVMTVATKIDKVSRGRRPKQIKTIRQRLDMMDEDVIVPFSAQSGEGGLQIWKGIQSFLADVSERSQRMGMT